MKKLFFIALIAVSAVNCKKEETLITPQELLLTSGLWKRAATDKNIATNPKGRVLYAPVLDCEKDDVYKFATSQLLTISTGKVFCSNNETAQQLDYSIDMAGKKITIGPVTYTLAELSANQLKYYISLPSQSGFDYVVFIFEH